MGWGGNRPIDRSIYIYLPIDLSIDLSIYLICMYVCIYISVYIYIFMNLSIHLSIYRHTHTHTNTYKYMDMYTHTHTHAHTQMHTHTYTYTHRHTHTVDPIFVCKFQWWCTSDKFYLPKSSSAYYFTHTSFSFQSMFRIATQSIIVSRLDVCEELCT